MTDSNGATNTDLARWQGTIQERLDGIAIRISLLRKEMERAEAIASEEREKAAAALRDGLAERIAQGDKALAAHIVAQIESVRAALTAQEKFATEVQRASKEAVSLALEASKELAEKHNDLIRAAEQKDATFSTKNDLEYIVERVESNKGEYLRRFTRVEQWQAKLTGGILVLAAIGLANFVKLWTG